MQLTLLLIFLRIQGVCRNEWTFRLSFHKTWDFHVYIHSPGDEMWLSFLAFPFQLVYFRLNTNNSDGMKITDVSISEKEIVTLAKEGSPCKSYMEMARFNNFLNLVISLEQTFSKM